jgi:hypothetical protein
MPGSANLAENQRISDNQAFSLGGQNIDPTVRPFFKVESPNEPVLLDIVFSSTLISGRINRCRNFRIQMLPLPPGEG